MSIHFYKQTGASPTYPSEAKLANISLSGEYYIICRMLRSILSCKTIWCSGTQPRKPSYIKECGGRSFQRGFFFSNSYNSTNNFFPSSHLFSIFWKDPRISLRARICNDKYIYLPFVSIIY